jgi:hypothetical protein
VRPACLLLVALSALPLSDAAAQKTQPPAKVEIVSPLPVPVTGQLNISRGLPYQHRFEFAHLSLEQISTVASDSVPSSQRLEVHFIQCHVVSFTSGTVSVVTDSFSISSSTGAEWLLLPTTPPYFIDPTPESNVMYRWGYSGPALLHFPAGDVVSVKATRAAGQPGNVGGACTLSGMLIAE